MKNCQSQVCTEPWTCLHRDHSFCYWNHCSHTPIPEHCYNILHKLWRHNVDNRIKECVIYYQRLVSFDTRNLSLSTNNVSSTSYTLYHLAIMFRHLSPDRRHFPPRNCVTYHQKLLHSWCCMLSAKSHMPGVMCQVSHAKCHIPGVTCRFSHTLTGMWHFTCGTWPSVIWHHSWCCMLSGMCHTPGVTCQVLHVKCHMPNRQVPHAKWHITGATGWVSEAKNQSLIHHLSSGIRHWPSAIYHLSSTDNISVLSSPFINLIRAWLWWSASC